MMGLRLVEGIDIAALAARLRLDDNAMVDNAAVARLTGHGLLHTDGPHLAVTPAGMLLLDAILPQIVV